MDVSIGKMFFLFLIGLLSTGAGRISGAGGAVLIKPILDATAGLSVSVISFLSGCTVWAMTASTLARAHKNPVKIEWKRSGFLALGAMIGGVIGQKTFVHAKQAFGNDQMVGAIQSALLFGIMLLVFFYVRNKDKIKKKNLQILVYCLLLGFILSFLSAFIGIGGGPLNVAILSYFLSMETKPAALNSLFIIFCSQTLSITTAILTKTIPDFHPALLIAMALSGICGSFIGGYFSKKMSSKAIDKLFVCIVILVLATSAYNFVRYV